MALDPITSRESLIKELETGWALFDGIYNSFGPAEWARKFGRTWTYAEQPYHLAYFDRMITKALREGPNSPPDRMHLRSLGDLNDWNRREFAKRPAGQTAQQSLEQMRASREELRDLVRSMSEQQLDQKAWMPLIFGWAPSRSVAQASVVHNLAEYWKLWIRTGKKAPAPSPSAVHVRLDFMMRFMPASMNRELAAKTPFTAVWHFDGPGGGAWTFRVRDGACTVTEELAAPADVTITMKPETFHKIVAKMTPPPLLMLTGEMKVKGFLKMGTFGKLFPEPKPEQIIEPTLGAFALG